MIEGTPKRIAGTYGPGAVGLAVLLAGVTPTGMLVDFYQHGWNADYQGRLSWMPHELFFAVGLLGTLVLVLHAAALMSGLFNAVEVVIFDEEGVTRRYWRWVIKASWAEIIGIESLHRPIAIGRSFVMIGCEPGGRGRMKIIVLPPWIRIDRGLVVGLIAEHRPDLKAEAERAFGVRAQPFAVASREPRIAAHRVPARSGPGVDSRGWTG
jgi:hypothetical protein